MKNLKIIIILSLIQLLTFNNMYSQDITFENINKICKGIDRKDRIKVTVARFSSKMNTGNYNELGLELATMLTNALHEVNCFRVLESASKINDFDQEFSMNDDGYTEDDGAAKGNMLRPQVIITGEITEFAEGKKSLSAFGFDVGKNNAHVGFVLKVSDLNTREILFSKSINSDGKSAGFNGLSLFGVKVAGKTNYSKALNDAIEKAIIKATEVLAKSKDEWGIESNANALNQKKRVKVVVDGISFSEVMNFSSKLSTISDVSKVSKSFKNGVGVFIVTSNLNGEDLAFAIQKAVGSSFEITSALRKLVKLKKKY